MKLIGKSFKNYIGIYMIKCKGNNQIYIGSSTNMQDRWRQHISHLRAGNHHSTYLQRSYNKYGEDSFEFSVLLQMFEPNEELLRLNEWYYIEQYKPQFNIASPVLYERTDEWKTKIAESTRKLYDNGYVNPRKGVGRKFNVYSKDLKCLSSNLNIMELCSFLNYKKENYRNINNYIRKNDGIFYYKTKNCILALSNIPIEQIQTKFSNIQIMPCN